MFPICAIDNGGTRKDPRAIAFGSVLPRMIIPPRARGEGAARGAAGGGRSRDAGGGWVLQKER
jgi:hypothetical protein